MPNKSCSATHRARKIFDILLLIIVFQSKLFFTRLATIFLKSMFIFTKAVNLMRETVRTCKIICVFKSYIYTLQSLLSGRYLNLVIFIIYYLRTLVYIIIKLTEPLSELGEIYVEALKQYQK